MKIVLLSQFKFEMGGSEEFYPMYLTWLKDVHVWAVVNDPLVFPNVRNQQNEGNYRRPVLEPSFVVEIS